MSSVRQSTAPFLYLTTPAGPGSALLPARALAGGLLALVTFCAAGLQAGPPGQAGALELDAVWPGFDRSGLGTEELLFYLPFEDGIKPLFARGKRDPIDSVRLERSRAEWRSDPDGVRGACLKLGAAGLPAMFDTAKNVNPAEGTFSIWVRPDEWDKVAAGWIVPGTFFVLTWKGSYPRLMMTNDRYYTRVLYFSSKKDWVATGVMGEREPRFRKSDRDKWYHLAMVWSATTIRTYVNGRLQGKSEGSFRFPPTLGAAFGVGAPAYSSVDEAMVFNRALTDAEIAHLAAFPATDAAAARAVAPRLAAAPQADGVLGDGEWSEALAFTGLIERTVGQVSSCPTLVHVGYDTANLYLGFRHDFPDELAKDAVVLGQRGPLTHDVGKPDGPVWQDDSFELLLAPNETATYRIVVNDRNTIYDARNGDASWQSAATVASRADLETWVLEISVPFRNLGGVNPGDSWGFNITRRGRMLGLAWESLHVDPAASIPTAGGILVFGSEKAGSISVQRLGDLKSGSVEFAGVGRALRAVRIASADGATELVRKPAAGRVHLATSLEQGVHRLCVSATGVDGASVLEQTLPFTFSQAGWLDIKAVPSRDLVRVGAFVAGARSGPAHTLTAALKRADEKLAQNEISFPGGAGAVTMDTRGVPPGAYRVCARVTRAGQTILKREFELEKKPRPEWLGNRSGLDDIVLEPWTPMTRDRGIVRLWNRAFHYADNLFFPSRIVSGGSDVLARPIEFRVDGVPLTGTSRLDRFSQTRVERSAQASVNGLGVSGNSRLEYDGMEWYVFTLSPDPAARVSDVRLVIPFRNEVAELYFRGIRHAGNFRNLPKRSAFPGPYHLLMVRNDECGLIWFAESQEGYSLEKPNECLRWEETGDAVEVTIQIVDHPLELTAERRIAFGFMTTPIRPAWKGWRTLRIGKLGAEHEAPPSIANWQFWWTFHGTRDAKNPADVASDKIVRPWNVLLPPYDDLRAKYAEWKRAGVTPLPYFNATGISPCIPEYKHFMEEWRIDPYPRPDITRPMDPRAHTKVCPRSSFMDFFFSLLAPGIEGALFQGAHVDLAGPVHCKNEYHGCGYADDQGERRTTLSYLATREYFRRFKCVLQQVHGGDRPTLLEGHPNPTLFPCGFLDCVATGENYVAEVGRHGHYHWIPLDQFRAVMAPHTGIMNVLLTQFARARQSERKLWFTDAKRPEVEHLIGLCLVHDAQVWPAYSINTPYQELWKAQDTFGWSDELEFLPYWRNAKYVNVENAGAGFVVSLYRKPGKLAMALLNHSDREQTPTLQFAVDVLGVPRLNGATLTDPVHNETHVLDGNRLQMRMAPWTYRFLIATR